MRTFSIQSQIFELTSENEALTEKNAETEGKVMAMAKLIAGFDVESI